MTWKEFKETVEEQGVTDVLGMEEVVWYMDEKPVVVLFENASGDKMFSIE